MNAPIRTLRVAGDLDDFRECCDHHRWYLDCGILALPVAVDNLQWLAERWGLVDQYGQDNIQREIARAVASTVLPQVQPEETSIIPEPTPRTYHTPQSTVDAFWYVVRAETPDHLTNWLAEHPRDKAHLHKIWERKCLSAAK